MAQSIPDWLEALPADEKPKARTKFLLKICALHATQMGRLEDLSVALGYHPRTLYQVSAGNAPMTPQIAVALEKSLGREVITREEIFPELFDTSL